MKKIACSLNYISYPKIFVAEKQSKIVEERDEEQVNVFNPFGLIHQFIQ
jgi:hypothetical protein